MHYKDGQEAQLGDLVKYPGWVTVDGKSVQTMREGFVVAQHPSTTTCNLTVMVPDLLPQGTTANPGWPQVVLGAQTQTAQECELVARMFG